MKTGKEGLPFAVTALPDFGLSFNQGCHQNEQHLRELKRCYHSTGDSLYLHQMGHLALKMGDLAQARMSFLAERQQIQPGEHLRLANNALAMGTLAQLRAEPCQAMLYVRASLRYARLAQNPALEQRCHQQLNQLMLLLGERPNAHSVTYTANQSA